MSLTIPSPEHGVCKTYKYGIIHNQKACSDDVINTQKHLYDNKSLIYIIIKL